MKIDGRTSWGCHQLWLLCFQVDPWDTQFPSKDLGGCGPLVVLTAGPFHMSSCLISKHDVLEAGPGYLHHGKTLNFIASSKNTSPRCLHLQLLFNSEAAVLLACVMTLLVSFVTPSRGQTAFDTAVLLCRCSVRDADSYRRLPFPISSVLVYVWVQIFSHSSFPSDWRIACLWVKYWCRVQTCAWQLGCNCCDDFVFLM